MDDDKIVSLLERDFDRIAHLLTYREQGVLKWLYGFHGEQQHAKEEISRRFSVSLWRIGEIQAKAIDLIRDNPPKAG